VGSRNHFVAVRGRDWARLSLAVAPGLSPVRRGLVGKAPAHDKPHALPSSTSSTTGAAPRRALLGVCKTAAAASRTTRCASPGPGSTRPSSSSARRRKNSPRKACGTVRAISRRALGSLSVSDGDQLVTGFTNIDLSVAHTNRLLPYQPSRISLRRSHHWHKQTSSKDTGRASYLDHARSRPYGTTSLCSRC
jgi:hypothetical protein